MSTDLERDLAHPARGRRRAVEHVDAPAPGLRVPLVHPVEIGGEEGGLLAAGACPDLDNHILLVGGITRKQRQREFALEMLERRGEPLLLLAPESTQLGVALRIRRGRSRVVECLRRLAILAVEPDDALETRPLSRDLPHPPVIGDHLRIGQQAGQLVEARLDLREPLKHLAAPPTGPQRTAPEAATRSHRRERRSRPRCRACAPPRSPRAA